MKSYKYIIRAHHLMCIQFFKGKGYSNEFTERMYKLLEELKHDSKILITDKEDYLCEVCPNRKELKPFYDVDADIYDKKVLDVCGIKAGDIMSYSTCKELVFKKILNPNKREEICGNCQWNDLCKFNNKI